jgi:hypothetical protein
MGRFEIWNLERDAIGKCVPFPTVPKITGRMQNTQNMLFMGGNQIFSFDSSKNEFEILVCQAYINETLATSSLTGGNFECFSTLKGSLQMFPGGLKRSVAYLQPNFILDYDSNTGDYTLVRLKISTGNDQLAGDCALSDDCAIEIALLAQGNLAKLYQDIPTALDELQTEYQVVGVGAESFLVKCKQSKNFITVKPFSEQTQSWNLAVTTVGSLDRFEQLIWIGQTSVLGYDPSSLDYAVLQCSSSGCAVVSQSSFLAGSIRPHFTSNLCFFNQIALPFNIFGLYVMFCTCDTELPCSYSTMSSCLQDKRCGYCIEKAECVQSSSKGPCFGSCQKWVSYASVSEIKDRGKLLFGGITLEEKRKNQKANLLGFEIFAVDTVKVAEEQIVYVGDMMVMHFIPSSGSVNLLAIVDNHPSHLAKCPSLSSEPVFSSSLPFINHVAYPFGDRKMFFHNPQVYD